MRNILLIFSILILSSCNQAKKSGGNGSYTAPDPEAIIQMNRNMLKDDMSRIEDYVKENQLDMKKSGTGLFYRLEKDEVGVPAADGDVVYFSYNIGNLKGDLLYSSNDHGLKEFKINKSEIESGWNEAAKMMSQGDEGLFILPPHLAFRNIGDGDKIGPGEALVYELRLDSVRREE